MKIPEKLLNLRIPAPVLVALWALAATAMAGHVMVQGDTFWHVKAGEWIIEQRCIPRTDPFSWTASGLPWHAHEWLWDVLAYLSWQAAGKWGVWGLMAAGNILFGAGAYALSCRFHKTWALPSSLVVISMTSFWWSARPHTLALGLFAVWFALFTMTRERPRLGVLLPPISALWANVHSSAAIAPIFALLWLISENGLKLKFNWKDPRFLSIIASLAAVGVNPWGFSIFSYVMRVSSNPLLMNGIDEWLSPDFHTFWGKLALIIILVLLAFWRRIPPELRVVSGAALAMSLSSARHLPFLFYFFGAGLTAALARSKQPHANVLIAGRALVLAASLAICALSPSPVWLENTQEAGQFPVRAVEFMQDSGLTDRVFNYYTWGGYLIFNGIPPFIDGRADLYELSGSGAFKDYGDATGINAPPDPDRVFTKWNVAAILFPSDTWLDLYLDKNQDWRPVYKDDTAVVYRRE